MFRVLSTHLFLNQRLHPGLLELASRSGVEAVEIFAARQHFDYTSREHVAELANWFRSNPLEPFSMHAPLFPDREMGRAGAPACNLQHPEKSRRIDAMDEIKRALESADQIHFRNLVLHLGERDDGWSQRSIEYAVTALEHLGAFARPLGVRLLVENLISEPTTPVHLLLILEMGHLPNVGVCLDLGHAHITVGVAEAMATLGSHIGSTSAGRSSPGAKKPPITAMSRPAGTGVVNTTSSSANDSPVSSCSANTSPLTRWIRSSIT